MDIKILVKPQKMILEKEVEGYCESGYNQDFWGTTDCGSGYRCGWTGVTSIVNDDEEDIIF